MAVSSLIIDIANDQAGLDARAILAADQRFTLGPALGTRQAIVLDTPHEVEDISAFSWLSGLPGVRWVTVVRVYLDNLALPPGAAADYL